MLESGRGAGDKPERGAVGLGLPGTGTLYTAVGLGAAVGAFVPVPCNSQAEPRTAGSKGRGSVEEKVGMEGNGGLREVCGGQAAGEGGTREQQIWGGKEKGPSVRGAAGARRGTEPRAGECAAPTLPPSCLRHRCLRPHIAVTPCLLSALAAAAPLSLSWHIDCGTIPALKHWLVPRVGGGGRGGPM